PRLWVGRGDDVNRADVVGLRHGTVDRDREGHGIAVLGDLGQIDEHLALDRLGIPEDLFDLLLPALACILSSERQRRAHHRHARGGTQGKLAAIGLARQLRYPRALAHVADLPQAPPPSWHAPLWRTSKARCWRAGPASLALPTGPNILECAHAS